MTTDNKFEEGCEAFLAWFDDPVYSEPINPYPPGSIEHEEWHTGWEDAFYSRFG